MERQDKTGQARSGVEDKVRGNGRFLRFEATRTGLVWRLASSVAYFFTDEGGGGFVRSGVIERLSLVSFVRSSCSNTHACSRRSTMTRCCRCTSRQSRRSGRTNPADSSNPPGRSCGSPGCSLCRCSSSPPCTTRSLPRGSPPRWCCLPMQYHETQRRVLLTVPE